MTYNEGARKTALYKTELNLKIVLLYANLSNLKLDNNLGVIFGQFVFTCGMFKNFEPILRDGPKDGFGLSRQNLKTDCVVPTGGSVRD
jgi:hypothetical protein